MPQPCAEARQESEPPGNVTIPQKWQAQHTYLPVSALRCARGKPKLSGNPVRHWQWKVAELKYQQNQLFTHPGRKPRKAFKFTKAAGNMLVKSSVKSMKFRILGGSYERSSSPTGSWEIFVWSAKFIPNFVKDLPFLSAKNSYCKICSNFIKTTTQSFCQVGCKNPKHLKPSGVLRVWGKVG